MLRYRTEGGGATRVVLLRTSSPPRIGALGFPDLHDKLGVEPAYERDREADCNGCFGGGFSLRISSGGGALPKMSLTHGFCLSRSRDSRSQCFA